MAKVSPQAPDLTARSPRNDLVYMDPGVRERLFQALSDVAPVIIWATNREGLCVFCNEGWRQFTGRDLEHELGDGWLTVVHPDDRGTCAEGLKHAIATQAAFSHEYRARRADGVYRWILDRGAPRFEGGHFLGHVGSCVDITERRQAEELLRKGEQRYRVLYDENPSMYFTLDRDGTVLSVNRFGAEQLGYGVEDLTGRSILPLFRREDQPFVIQRLAQCIANPAATRDWETAKIRRDGSLMWVRETARALQAESGEDVVYVVCEDVTERKQAERHLQRYKEIVSTTTGFLAFVDTAYRYQVASGAYRQGIGIEPDAVLGRTIAEVFGERMFNNVIKPRMDRCLAGEEVRYQAWFDFPGSGRRFINAHYTPFREPNGRITGAVINSQDITERKTWTDEIAVRAKQQAAVAELGQLALHDLPLQGLFDQAVQAVAEGLEAELAEILEPLPEFDALLRCAGSGWTTESRPTLPGADGERSQVRFTLATEGAVLSSDLGSERRFSPAPWALDLGARSLAGIAVGQRERPWGLLFAYGVSARQFTAQDVSFLQAVANILAIASERRRAGETLKRSERRFRQMFERGPLGMALLNPGHRFVRANAMLCRMLGYAEDELTTLRLADVSHPDDLARHVDMADRLHRRDIEQYRIEVRLFRQTGEPLWARLTTCRLDAGPGKSCCALAMIEDISDRKTDEEKLTLYSSELRILSRRLLEVQEQERRHLARELHDEIGQTLTAVKLSLETVMGATAAQAGLRMEFDEAIAGVSRVLSQVRDLSLDLRPSLLDDLGLTAAVRWYLHRQTQKAGIKGELYVEGSEAGLAPTTRTVCFRIVQEALTNIVRHARADLVIVEIRCEGEALNLFVSDDGVGFDAQAAERASKSGQSFGLLGMRERAQLAGGGFRIDSCAGGGTVVAVRLPGGRQEGIS